MNSGVLIGICSIAATIIAALIQRSWQWSRRKPPRYEQLAHGDLHESDSFSVTEAVKIIDLSGSPGTDQVGSAQLTDSYLVRREADQGNGLVCRYATSGTLAAECVSHAIDVPAGEYESSHYAKRLAIGVPLDHLARGNHARIINKVVFSGAFDKPDGEDFETHIERPTKSLTFILIFSADRPCSVVTGYFHASERGRLEEVRSDPPMIADEGKVVYWRIMAKKDEWLPLGASYQLRWTWHTARRSPRTPRAAAGEAN